jgi:hypothetical protein
MYSDVFLPLLERIQPVCGDEAVPPQGPQDPLELETLPPGVEKVC